jgi:hypothetical protein
MAKTFGDVGRVVRSNLAHEHSVAHLAAKEIAVQAFSVGAPLLACCCMPRGAIDSVASHKGTVKYHPL